MVDNRLREMATSQMVWRRWYEPHKLCTILTISAVEISMQSVSDLFRMSFAPPNLSPTIQLLFRIMFLQERDPVVCRLPPFVSAVLSYSARQCFHMSLCRSSTALAKFFRTSLHWIGFSVSCSPDTSCFRASSSSAFN